MQEWRYVAVSNDAALVEDVQRTLGETIVVAVHLILPRHLTFGVEVSEQWETNATNRGPCAVTVNAVDGDPDERGTEPLELGQQGLAKPRAPELAYGASLFTSPSRLPSSRACSCPWTRAEVRTPMPQSLMNPAAADWSNASPFP